MLLPVHQTYSALRYPGYSNRCKDSKKAALARKHIRSEKSNTTKQVIAKFAFIGIGNFFKYSRIFN